MPTVPAQPARCGRRARALHSQVPTWRCAPVVEALQAWRGVQCPVAVTTVAARGDLTRVETPRQLHAFPGAHTLGICQWGAASARQHDQDGPYAMRVVLSSKARGPTGIRPQSVATGTCAWQSSPPRSRPSAGRPRSGSAHAIAHLMATGNHAHQVVVAMARALRAFMWAMAQQVPVPPQA